MFIPVKYNIGQKVWVNDNDMPKELEIMYIKYLGCLTQYRFTNGSSAPEERVHATKEEALLNREKDRREIDYDYNTEHKKQAKG